MRRIPPYIGTDGDLRSGRVHGEDARHDPRGNMQPPPWRGLREARGWACINHPPVPPSPSKEGEIRPKGPFVGPSISAESANEADSALHRHRWRPAVRSRARRGRAARSEGQHATPSEEGVVYLPPISSVIVPPVIVGGFRADTGVCPYAVKFPDVGVLPRL